MVSLSQPMATPEPTVPSSGQGEPVRRSRPGRRQAHLGTLAIAWHFAKLDLARRYRPAMLGILWGVLSPLCMAAIIGTVFGKLFGVELQSFLPYLFLNLTLWAFFSGAVDGGAIAFIAAEGYIKQIAKVSLFAYPLRMVLGAFLTLLLSFIAVVGIHLAFGGRISLAWLWLLPGLAAWLGFGFGVACLAGVINTALRDFQHIQSLILQVLFYATPIIFPARLLVDHGLQWLLTYNPLYHLIVLIQVPLLYGDVPPINHVIAVALTLAAMIAAGVTAVNFARPRLVFWL